MPDPTPEDIERAADVLRAGGLVAFPTETVYGLGADARNPSALRRLFAVKGRPPTQALTVHLGTDARPDDWAADVPREARRLMEACWPGPLTLVLRRGPDVPDLVTAGGDTVGLRVPDQPVALQLLRRFGGGVAAPSANRHGGMSPTTAEAVRAELGDDVDALLDDGPCRLGIESTIVDCSRGQPRVLRLGALGLEDIERVAGPVRVVRFAERAARSRNRPGVAVEVVDDATLRTRARELLAQGRRVGVIALSVPGDLPDGTVVLDEPGDVEEYARNLYGRLREGAQAGLDVVLAVPPPEEGVGVAVADRLRRAASGA